MKNLIAFIIVLFSAKLQAATGYDIAINESGYDLKMEMNFSGHQSLESIRQAIIKSDVISKLSPNVKSVTNTGNENHYNSLMVVKSFGIKSELLSKCDETFLENSWSRSCSLQTDQLDSGKFMQWKTDQVVCSKIDEVKTVCKFEIKGKTKPVKILGIQLVSERIFAVKAKYQAMNNFFKIFYYISDHNISTKLALEKFEHSQIKMELDHFESEASSKLKNESSYVRSYQMKDL